MSDGAADREGFAAFLLRLRRLGLASRPLLEALEATPRGSFLSPHFAAAAWSNRMLPLDCGEAVEGADLQARVLASLNLEPQHRVLEIGTGSGFTAAVMARLAARVLTVERWRTLANSAQARFEALEVANVTVRQADGSNGVEAADGPFDRIVVWGSFDALPKAFVDQVATGGVIIAPIGAWDGAQDLARFSKQGSRFERQDIGMVRLQPLLRGLSASI
jgi:protein-L-isoaspartate(D-aspartate) O-methyltransferase